VLTIDEVWMIIALCLQPKTQGHGVCIVDNEEHPYKRSVLVKRCSHQRRFDYRRTDASSRIQVRVFFFLLSSSLSLFSLVNTKRNESGWLWAHGIDFAKRAEEVKHILLGEQNAKLVRFNVPSSSSSSSFSSFFARFVGLLLTKNHKK